MASNHTDKLVKSFLSGTSDPHSGGAFDQFSDLQDPTYITFKLDFFPDKGMGFPDDAYSSGGLFRTASQMNADNIPFFDSAANYLARIGAPARQMYLEIFANLLYRLQEKAPWYFQSVTGVSDLYKIDPAINYRGKEKVLTIECLESIDLRMTLLADTYRNLSFDMQNMREVLPVNLRTFNMNIHVMEFRKFNTTFGIIADSLDKSRDKKGQANQDTDLEIDRTNVFPQPSLFSGTSDNINSQFGALNNKLGGLFTNLGDQSGEDYETKLKSAFEAISVQTFVLKDCEFDFFSEAPGYLDTLSVKDISEATSKFKIKVGKIQKTTSYSFDNFVISEHAKNTFINPAEIINSDLGRTKPDLFGTTWVEPYFDQTSVGSINNKDTFYAGKRESIFPSDGNTTSKRIDYLADSRQLRKDPLDKLLKGLLGNATKFVNNEINNALGDLTGGILGNNPGANTLGNVYGNPTVLREAAQQLNVFLDNGNANTFDAAGNPVRTNRKNVLQNIKFEALNIDSTKPSTNILAAPPFDPGFAKENIYQNTIPLPTNDLGKENIFTGNPLQKVDKVAKENIFKGTPAPHREEIGKENIYYQTPAIPTDIAQKRNVFTADYKQNSLGSDKLNNDNVFN